MPDWLPEALFTAVGGVLGFFGKSWIESRRAKIAARMDALRQLKEFAALLEESYSVFQSQIYLAKQLLASVRANHPGETADVRGYDDTFRAAFDVLTPQEAEIHALVRGMTMHPMLRLNETLKAWIDRNGSVVRELPQTAAQAQLEQEIAKLAKHLNEWFSKYHALLPTDKKRSVIFLADEKQQGTRFPQDLTPALKTVIAEMVAR
jgi:hypothetical protein